MNWGITLIESGIWCLLFTALILIFRVILKKDTKMAALDYPPKIIERLIKIGKIKEEKPLPFSKRLKKKLPLLIIYLVVFTCLLYFVNGCRTFISGFLSSFIIMSIWDWYDALFLDCVLFCNTKLFVIEGTEDMVEEYHNYWFHIKGSLIAMILVTLGSLAVGGLIALISLF